MIRAFFAVQPTGPLPTHLSRIQSELKQRLSPELSKDVRLTWVQPSSIHLTIKFLGDIDEQLAAALKAPIAHILSAHQAIEIPLDRLGVFPRLQQARVIWVGPSKPWESGPEAQRLASLHQAIDACCSAHDLAPDSKPLTAHLTLARIKDGGRAAGQALARSGVMDRPLSLGSLRVGAVVLMQSELSPSGSRYTKLWEAGMSPSV